MRAASKEHDAGTSWGEGAEVISPCIVAATNLIKQRLASIVGHMSKKIDESGNDTNAQIQKVSSDLCKDGALQVARGGNPDVEESRAE